MLIYGQVGSSSLAGNCILASMQIKLQLRQRRQRRENFLLNLELSLPYPPVPSPNQPRLFSFMGIQMLPRHNIFPCLVKVNYENQRKLTAEISKSAEKLMNLREKQGRISAAEGCWGPL